jgi:ATP-dependent DNA helicase RecQ
MDLPTRIRIDVERDQLYYVDLPDARMPAVLESLMRLYTGIFSVATPIDEEEVARRSGVDVPQLRQLLYGLSVNHVVRYIPADHATVLYLEHDRLRPGNVQLSPKRYELLRSRFRERVQTMTAFVEQEDECRSRYLLRYFGQEDSAPCGRCDVCRSHKETPRNLAQRIREWIGSRGGRYTLADLRTAFGPGDEAWTGVLRELVDRGDVPPYEL